VGTWIFSPSDFALVDIPRAASSSCKSKAEVVRVKAELPGCRAKLCQAPTILLPNFYSSLLLVCRLHLGLEEPSCGEWGDNDMGVPKIQNRLR
jgi:hypothetical protein